jgi:hypothetical protein
VSGDQGRMEAARTAAQRLAMEGNTSGFTKLAAQFVATLPEHSAGDVKAALDASGIRSYQDPNSGGLVLEVPGVGPLSWKAAIKQNLIRVRSD